MSRATTSQTSCSVGSTYRLFALATYVTVPRRGSLQERCLRGALSPREGRDHASDSVHATGDCQQGRTGEIAWLEGPKKTSERRGHPSAWERIRGRRQSATRGRPRHLRDHRRLGEG